MRILVRSTNWVGDCVMSLPALRSLRAGHPDAHLAVHCRPSVADLYRLRPEVDEVLVEDSRGEHAGLAGRERFARDLAGKHFDLAVVLPRSFDSAWVPFRAGIPRRIGYRGELRSPLLTRALPFRPSPGEHESFRHLRLAEAAGGATAAASALPDVSWSVGEAESRGGKARLAEAGWDGSPFVAAHLASFAHAAKRWDFVRFAALFDRLAVEEGLSVVLLGSAGEKGVNREAASLLRTAPVLDLSGRTSLPEVLGILSNASLFVGNDSGISHLSGSVGTPTVVVFGPTDPEGTRPWDGPRGDGRPSRVALVRRPPLCAPCRFRVCPIDHACMKAVAVEDVLAACRGVRPE